MNHHGLFLFNVYLSGMQIHDDVLRGHEEKNLLYIYIFFYFIDIKKSNEIEVLTIQTQTYNL